MISNPSTTTTHFLEFFKIASILLISCIIAIFILSKIARYVGLIDKPNFRKKHSGNIPLIGGISIYFGLLIQTFFFSTIPLLPLLLGCSTFLLIVGVLDDRYDISFKIRFAVQIIIAVLIAFYGP